MTQQTQMETINLATDVLVVGAGMTGVKAATEIAATGPSAIPAVSADLSSILNGTRSSAPRGSAAFSAVVVPTRNPSAIKVTKRRFMGSDSDVH